MNVKNEPATDLDHYEIVQARIFDLSYENSGSNL
jgi:hypothetical protein